jgi:hypothetical protein
VEAGEDHASLFLNESGEESVERRCDRDQFCVIVLLMNNGWLVAARARATAGEHSFVLCFVLSVRAATNYWLTRTGPNDLLVASGCETLFAEAGKYRRRGPSMRAACERNPCIAESRKARGKVPL